MKNLILLLIGILVIFLGTRLVFQKINETPQTIDTPQIAKEDSPNVDVTPTPSEPAKLLEVDLRELEDSKPSEETTKNWLSLREEEVAKYPEDWTVFGENYFRSFSKYVTSETGRISTEVQLYYMNSEGSLEEYIQEYSVNIGEEYPDDEKSQFKINDYDVTAYPNKAFMKKDNTVIVVTISVIASGSPMDDSIKQDLVTTAMQIVSTLK